MVKVSENENLNGDEKGQRTNWDVIFDNPAFAAMCEAAEEAENAEKALAEYLCRRCQAYDRGLLEILDSIRADLLRKLDTMAVDDQELKKAQERFGVGIAASALASASCFARQLLYGASAEEQVEEARVFDRWLADHGINLPRRVIDMGTGREEGKDA